jgi:hypothetical protein
MSGFSYAYRGLGTAALIAGAILLCGFTFRQGGPPELHYREYNALPPHGNTVTVCHAHGCQEQASFTFTDTDISDLGTVMDYVRGGESAEGERRAVAYAIAWMERRVGPATGTAGDRPSLGFLNASGQLDCVDEATNSTSYLLVLQKNGLLRHHFVIRPYSKASFFKWPHFAAMMQERASGKVYAIDSGVGPNGANPAITLASKWYIDDSYTAPDPVPVPTVATITSPSSAQPVGSMDLGVLVEQVLREDNRPAPQPGTLDYAASRLR